jgi:hypothetical protein
VFQSPSYKKGSWALAITFQRSSNPIEQLLRRLDDRHEFQIFKIVGILEVDHSLDLSALLDEVHFSALNSCHPLLLPVALLEYHVQESARHFMTISHKLSSVEDAIDPLAAERSLLATTPTPGSSSRQSYGVLSKTVYECNKSLYELERRRDYEKRLHYFLKTEIEDDKFQMLQNLENEEKMLRRLHNVKTVGNNRDLDMKSLPLRIEALTNLVNTRSHKAWWTRILQRLRHN